MKKRYLGDAVYVEVLEDGTVVLTTENGITRTNVIHLEPEVLSALLKFVENEVLLK